MTEERRLRPPEEHERTIESLVKTGVFETKQAALTFAAALGWFRKSRRSFVKGGEGVRWQVFEHNEDSEFIYALAVATEKSIEVLDPDMKDVDTVAAIFEQFAAGGFDKISESLANNTGDVLDTLLLMLAEARRESTAQPAGLGGLSSGALDALGL